MGNLEQDVYTTMFFITEELKENILQGARNFSQGSMRVL